MTSTAVLVPVMAVVLLLLLTLSLLNARRTEKFRAHARRLLWPTFRGTASGNVAVKDLKTITLYSRQPTVALSLTRNDVVLLPSRVQENRRARKAVVELVDAYQILLTNTMTFPTLHLNPHLSPSRNSITDTTKSHVFTAYGAGRIQLKNYIDIAIPRVGYSLKFNGRISDLQPHDIARTPRDTLTTPEVGKFANILGVTALCRVHRSDFEVTYMIRAPWQRATYVSLVGRGPDLKLTSFNHWHMRNKSAGRALRIGDATRDNWIRRNRKVNVQTFRGALVGASRDIDIKLEVQPGRVRCFVETSGFRRAYVIAMPILDFSRNLRTHPTNPPQMAWRARNTSLKLFPFPMGDLSFEDDEVIKRV